MNRIGKRVALCGMMCALGVILLLPGGVITVAAFACPMLASMCLLPILIEIDGKWAMMCWAAISMLGLMLCPDRECVLLFMFLGWYPVLKPKLVRVANVPLRTLCKLLLFNACAGLMLASMVFVFGMQAVLAEYTAMGKAMLIVYIIAVNITMLLYDRTMTVMPLFYTRVIRPKLKGLL